MSFLWMAIVTPGPNFAVYVNAAVIFFAVLVVVAGEGPVSVTVTPASVSPVTFPAIATPVCEAKSWPVTLAPLIVLSTAQLGSTILTEASLSFLGLGQQPPAPSWGSMLNAAQRFLTQAPWMAIWPGLAIFLVVLGITFLLFAVTRGMMHSPYGLALRSFRDNPTRALAIGIPVDAALTNIYTYAAVIAGIAGALLTQTTQFVSLDVLSFQRSAGHAGCICGFISVICASAPLSS